MNESEKIQKLNIELIVPNQYQPRKIFNEESLKELASSIKEYGILNPILVRQVGDKYEIIAGERRFRAAKMAGLTEVPTIIKNIDNNKLAEIALIENLQREDITPIEEAKSYEQILSLSSKTEQELSSMLGKSQPYISNKLRLLKLPEKIQQALLQKKISERHARSLLMVEDEEKQNELLDRIITERLTVKELDNIINEKQIEKDEIENALSDLMKSLEINEKEEKESDNMNEGNFFPNMNNNNMGAGMPNASLNLMNEQTVNQPAQANPQGAPELPPMPPIDLTPPMPQPPAPMQVNLNPIPNFNEQPNNNAAGANNIPIEEPLFGGMNNVAPPTPPVSEGPTLEVPSAPVVENTPPMPPQEEKPLFNSELKLPTPGETIYGVPTNVPEPPSIGNVKEIKLREVEDLLNSNGIKYKSYGNETGHCIIIEL